jgi:hypothetical protein
LLRRKKAGISPEFRATSPKLVEVAAETVSATVAELAAQRVDAGEVKGKDNNSATVAEIATEAGVTERAFRQPP